MLRVYTIAAIVATAVAAATQFAPVQGAVAGAGIAPLPQRLSDTGLFVGGSTTEIRSENLPFTPQYPLWSDGATKRRWIFIPPGSAIDASDPNAWEFPRGTRLWKEFSVGRRIETRLIERLADGSWRFATYVWNEAGTEALLAPERGVRALPVAAAPDGKYAVPSQGDCRACHDGAPAPVLGVNALQLSPDRDPLAPHAETPGAGDVDLRALVARGWLRNLPRDLLTLPPRIAAASPAERAALGYLHANCSHCHNAAESGAGVPVELMLAHDVTAGAASTAKVLRSMVGVPSRYKGRVAPEQPRLVEPGTAEASMLLQRMRSRDPRVQMPPIGTAIPDDEGLALVARWINHDLLNRKGSQ